MTFYGAWRINVRLEQVNHENVPRVRAEEAEIALADGDRSIAIYLVDKTNPSWASDYHAAQLRFQNWLETLRNQSSTSDKEREILSQLEEKWADLDAQRGKAISLWDKGELDKAKALLRDIDAGPSLELRGLCEQLISLYEQYSKDIVSHHPPHSHHDVGGRTFRRLDAAIGWIPSMDLLLPRARAVARHGCGSAYLPRQSPGARQRHRRRRTAHHGRLPPQSDVGGHGYAFAVGGATEIVSSQRKSWPP